MLSPFIISTPQLQTMPVYPPGSTVRVMHDYTPPKEHCLKLTVGETIQVVESKNMDCEWVAGKNKDGQVGFFPALYVELLVVNKVTKENPETVETVVEKKTTSSSAAASPPAPAASATPAAAAASKLAAVATALVPKQEEEVGRKRAKPKGLRLNKIGSHRSLNHSIGSVPSPRWLAPAHLTTVALFKYFADGHFGFDDTKGCSGGGLFKKRITLKVADLLKFGKKPIKLPLHRSLWTSELEERGKSGLVKLTTGMIVKAQQLQQNAVENFKNIMRYMNDIDGDHHHHHHHHHHTSSSSSSALSGGEGGVIRSAEDMMERDSLRSKVLQLGLSTLNNTSANSSTTTSPSGGGSQMCDEIWCQLIKQTTSNPKEVSLISGWELLATISSVFKPSIELFPCVFQFVYDRCLESSKVGGLAVYTLRQLMTTKNIIQTPSARHQANLVR